MSQGTLERAGLWLQEGVAKREETRWREPDPFDNMLPADVVAAADPRIPSAMPGRHAALSHLARAGGFLAQCRTRRLALRARQLPQSARGETAR